MTEIEIQTENDIVVARNTARAIAGELDFSLIDKTRIATAVSELARNTLVHGHGGCMQVEPAKVNGSSGLRCVFVDSGPGIADIEQALQDGFSTAGSLGQGLPGAKRLTDDFLVESEPGQGTRVEIVKWK